MKTRWKRWVVWGAVIAGLVLAARAMRHFPWVQVWHALASAGPGWIAASALLTVLSLLAKGWGWHLLMTGGSSAGLVESERAHMMGAAAMALTVSVGAEAVRVSAVVPRLKIPVSRAVAAAAWSRIAETIALVFLLLPATLLTVPPSLRHLRLPAVGLSILAMMIVALLLAPELRRRLLLPALMRPFPDRWRARMSEIGAVGGGRHMIGPLLLALLNWLLQWVAYDAAMRAVGIHANPAAAFTVMVAVNLGGLFHLTPGNLGVLQAGTVVVLGVFGVSAATALAAGLILQAVQTLPPILIGAAVVGSPLRVWKTLVEAGKEPSDDEAASSR